MHSALITDARRPAVAGLLLIVFLLGMGLRLYELDTHSLWLDEVKTVLTSRLDFYSMLSYQASDSVHPPLLYIVTRIFLALFGNSDFMVRLQATLLGSLTLLLTYKLGEMLWTPREGLLGAFLLAINAYHIRYSQEARHYSLMVFLGLLSLILLLKALKSDQKKMWVLFGICAGLNVYTHYFAFLILASETLFAAWFLFDGWLSSKRRCQQIGVHYTQAPECCLPPAASADGLSPAHSTSAVSSRLPSPGKQALHLVAALGILGVSYLPWLPFMYQQLSGRLIQFEGLGKGNLPGADLSLAFFADALQVYTRMSGVVLLLFLALFALGLARSRGWRIVLFAVWIPAPMLFPFIVRAGHFYSYRYAAYVVPVLLLGIAGGISLLTAWVSRHIARIRDQDRWGLSITSALTVVFLGAINVAPVTAYYQLPKTDYRGVARYLEQRLMPADIVVTDGLTYRQGQDAGWTERCLSYYMEFYHREETPILLVQRGFWSQLQELGESDGEIWAVLGRRRRPLFWDKQTDLVVVDFEDLSVVRLRQPTGDLPQDAVSMLEALTRLLRMPDAQFDVRLALAEAYAGEGREVNAGSQVVRASTVMPDDERAASDLAEATSQLQPTFDIQLTETKLDDSLSLVGHSVRRTSLRAGDAVRITLWWQRTARMEMDYTAFVHILRPDGQILVQQDRLLQSGNRPTSKWRAGEVVSQDSQLLLPSNAEPGQYIVTTGVYYWRTGERLPVCDAEGQRLANDAITLGTITVGPP
jgi:uncharacterized membrane protein